MDERIIEELRKIRGNDPTIDPAKVVAFAKNPKTALHSRFEWNDKAASHEYRLWQARQVCRAFVTVLDTGESDEPVRMFVSVRKDDETRGYVPTAEVLNDAEMRRDLVAAQLTRLWNIYNSYPLPELKSVGRAIQRCRDANAPVLVAAE
jgi:hypothetical protein